MAKPGRLYEQPNLKATVVRDLDPGMMLYPTGDKQGIWWKVNDELGNEGWVPSSLFEAGPVSRFLHAHSQISMPALSVRGLTKTYRNGVQALRGVDLDVEQGDFFALLGPNGAGKTTLIGIITSLVNKTAGTARVFGYDLDTQLERAKSCIGVVPQELNFNQFESAVHDRRQPGRFLRHPAAPKRGVRAEKYLHQLQLWEKRSGIARGLSGGMKRRLMIARALMHEPRLLVLDEPSAGVDIEVRRSMWEFLQDINSARHDDHPHHALSRGGREPVPQYRDHRPVERSSKV